MKILYITFKLEEQAGIQGKDITTAKGVPYQLIVLNSL